MKPAAMKRAARAPGLVVVCILAACPTGCSPVADRGDRESSAQSTGKADDPSAASGPCPAGGDGLDCLFALHDQVAAGCDADRFDDLFASLEARVGSLPAWHDGRALFVSVGDAVAPAGTWNGWSPDQATEPVCGTDLHTAAIAIPSGWHEYKLVGPGGWRLDPFNWAFAYDSFAGNPDGRNSVVDTYDSGVGHLVQPPDPLCSDALGNCRAMIAYLPPGYGAPENAGRTYPAAFVHDAQNVFDDETCCFGHGGWELNRTIDREIADGAASELIVVAAEHGGAQRLAEYGGELTDAFMDFQVGTVQPAAASLWRIDPARVFTAGSSLGGLISFRLAFAHPDVYAGAASLSGSFFIGEEPGDQDGRAMREIVEQTGLLPLSLYVDHGGRVEDGADNLPSNQRLIDALVAAGWARSTSPGCAAGPGQLCTHHEVGGAHDEVAWRERSWRTVRTLFPPP